MSIYLEISSEHLSDLQQHMAQLVKYYECDVAILGRIGDHVTGETLEYLRRMTRIRLEQLNNADNLWDLLCKQ